MTCRGTVKNGVVLLDAGVVLPEGTQVEVKPLDERRALEEQPLLKYARLARKTGLPSDYSAQHDHYIHGTPRQ